jgi:hypothetical protein
MGFFELTNLAAIWGLKRSGTEIKKRHSCRSHFCSGANCAREILKMSANDTQLTFTVFTNIISRIEYAPIFVMASSFHDFRFRLQAGGRSCNWLDT